MAPLLKLIKLLLLVVKDTLLLCGGRRTKLLAMTSTTVALAFGWCTGIVLVAAPARLVS